MKRYKYPYIRYNRFDVVKVNAPTMASVLFLSRHILIFLLIGLALGRARVAGGNAYAGLVEPVYMLSDLPALLVFLAMMARHPKSGRSVRLIWHAGPYLLLVSALGYFALLVRQLGPDPTRYVWPIWVVVGATVVAVGYIFLSGYARDVFREFPDARLDDAGERKK